MPYSISKLVIVYVVLFHSSAYACGFPDPVPIPDGKTATEREMIATDLSIKRYMLRMQAYIDCVVLETHAQRTVATRNDMTNAKLREERSIQLQNEAAAAMEHAAELFNDAIAKYREQIR